MLYNKCYIIKRNIRYIYNARKGPAIYIQYHSSLLRIYNLKDLKGRPLLVRLIIKFKNNV